MKTLHNPIIIGVISSMIIGGVIFVMFQTIISGPSIQHQTIGNVEIQNIQVQPHTIKVGNTFTVNATIVNNSQNTIYVDVSPCRGSFSVIFDSHVTVDVKQTACEDLRIIGKINPSEKIIIVGPDPTTTTFMATAAGTTNATVTFSYFIKNQTDPNQSEIWKSISKSFLFTISN